jgi:hypothetical protein
LAEQLMIKYRKRKRSKTVKTVKRNGQTDNPPPFEKRARPLGTKRHQYSSKRAFMRPTKSLALMCGAERGQTAAKETAGKQANGRVLQRANER